MFYTYFSFVHGSRLSMRPPVTMVPRPHLPRGVPGEGPDCHDPADIIGFGPIPARIRRVVYLQIVCGPILNLIVIRPYFKFKLYLALC